MHDRNTYYYDTSDGYYTNSTGPSMADLSEAGHNYRNRKKKQTKKVVEWTRGKIVAFVLTIAMLAGLCGFGGSLLTGHSNQTSQSSGSGSISSAGFDLESATGSKMTVQEISKVACPSVVEIRTESVEQGMWVQEYVTEGAGSGVIIKDDGYIVTNNHVIDGASKIYVTIDESDKEYEADLIGTDAANDVAVLKIDAKDLTAATMGNSDEVAAGDMAVVIGNPLGELGDSVSAGIISSTARKVTIENQEMTLMQTDASVNPGNSGGGLFNNNGQMVGLIVAKSSGSDIEGLGFAIPINTAAKSVENILAGNGDNQQSEQESPDDQNGQQDPWRDQQDSPSFFDFFF